MNIPPKDHQGIDFVIKGKGIEETICWNRSKRHTHMQNYIYYAQHILVYVNVERYCVKDPVETKFVGLSDYECFNAKEGTVSMPYHHGNKTMVMHQLDYIVGHVVKENCKNICYLD